MTRALPRHTCIRTEPMSVPTHDVHICALQRVLSHSFSSFLSLSRFAAFSFLLRLSPLLRHEDEEEDVVVFCNRVLFSHNTGVVRGRSREDEINWEEESTKKGVAVHGPRRDEFYACEIVANAYRSRLVLFPTLSRFLSRRSVTSPFRAFFLYACLPFSILYTCAKGRKAQRRK